MGFIFQPPSISQQYFCSLKTNPNLLLATELWWVQELAVGTVVLAGWECTDPHPNSKAARKALQNIRLNRLC